MTLNSVPKQKPTIELKGVDALAVLLVAVMLIALVGGLVFMCLMAALHAAFSAIPTIGYWSAAGIILFARLTAHFVKP
jgi:hypothetical protein